MTSKRVGNRVLTPDKDLDYPLIQLGINDDEILKLSDAVRGIQIFGGIGSGKTSGSGTYIASAFLEAGLGGIVLCAKPGEREHWEMMARMNGRENDLIIFDEASGLEFNPLIYELTRTGNGAGDTMNIVNLFMNIFQLGQRISGSEARESNRFWENALKRLLSRTIDLLKLADEELSINNMVRVVSTAPIGQNYLSYITKLANEEKRTGKQDLLEKWHMSSYCTECLWYANANVTSDEENSLSQSLQSYFLKEIAELAHDTRSGLFESLYGITEQFRTGILAKQFGKGLTIKPELTFSSPDGIGKIIILDFPIKTYLEAGIYAQGIFKLMWQQAVERRKILPGSAAIPVFLWVDESQFFLTEYDMLFQTTARSSRACTVFLTQNISNYYAVMGGSNPKAKVDSLLGNLSTKIFHANTDFETNQWAANLIGKAYSNVSGFTVGMQGRDVGLGTVTGSLSNSKQFHYKVHPHEFITLRGGGIENMYVIDAYIVTTGKEWKIGDNAHENYKKIELAGAPLNQIIDLMDRGYTAEKAVMKLAEEWKRLT